jgi:hypothetical protein
MLCCESRLDEEKGAVSMSVGISAGLGDGSILMCMYLEVTY